jgi:hypothetical protein
MRLPWRVKMSTPSSSSSSMNAWLGGEQRLGGVGQVEILADRLADEA